MSISSGQSNWPMDLDLHPISGTPTISYLVDQEINPLTGTINVSGTLMKGVQVNSVYSILQAIETNLGVNPQGNFASTVAQRLSNIEASGVSFVSGTFVHISGDSMLGTLNAPTLSGTIINNGTINSNYGLFSNVVYAPVLSGTTISGSSILLNGNNVIVSGNNLGTGLKIFNDKNVNNLEFNTVSGVGSISVSLLNNVISVSGSSSSSLTTPSSTTNNTIATFSGTTGSGLLDTGIIIDTNNNLFGANSVNSNVISGTTISGNTLNITGATTGIPHVFQITFSGVAGGSPGGGGALNFNYQPVPQITYILDTYIVNTTINSIPYPVASAGITLESDAAMGVIANTINFSMSGTFIHFLSLADAILSGNNYRAVVFGI